MYQLRSRKARKQARRLLLTALDVQNHRLSHLLRKLEPVDLRRLIGDLTFQTGLFERRKLGVNVRVDRVQAAQVFAAAIRELLGEYIRTVKGGTIEPHVNNNWKIVGNNWKAADHQKAVQLLREGKLALNENADARTLPGKAITTADIAKF